MSNEANQEIKILILDVTIKGWKTNPLKVLLPGLGYILYCIFYLFQLLDSYYLYIFKAWYSDTEPRIMWLGCKFPATSHSLLLHPRHPRWYRKWGHSTGWHGIVHRHNPTSDSQLYSLLLFFFFYCYYNCSFFVDMAGVVWHFEPNVPHLFVSAYNRYSSSIHPLCPVQTSVVSIRLLVLWNSTSASVFPPIFDVQPLKSINGSVSFPCSSLPFQRISTLIKQEFD